MTLPISLWHGGGMHFTEYPLAQSVDLALFWYSVGFKFGKLYAGVGLKTTDHRGLRFVRRWSAVRSAVFRPTGMLASEHNEQHTYPHESISGWRKTEVQWMMGIHSTKTLHHSALESVGHESIRRLFFNVKIRMMYIGLTFVISVADHKEQRQKNSCKMLSHWHVSHREIHVRTVGCPMWARAVSKWASVWSK